MLPQILTPVPGPKSVSLAAELRRYESRNVTHVAEGWPIFWERAEGVNVWDADGNRYLDFTSAFGVTGLGHSNPAVLQALHTQAHRLVHAMGDVHPTALKVELCRRLSALTFERWGYGAARTILGNSGSDAVEAALKTSLLRTGKLGVIAFTGGYHGLGMGSVAAGGLPWFRTPFRAQLADFTTWVSYPHCFRCPFGSAAPARLEGEPFPSCCTGCLGRIEEEIAVALREREIGCILVEPIQGRGGIIAPPLGFLPLLRRICDREHLLLIADEIYTGFNRTGALFACEHSGTVPDLVCLGKGLASGFPISACVGRAEVMDAWPESTGEALHTSTFLGNPLGCAMAVTSLEEHARPATGEAVRRQGARLREALQAIHAPAAGQVRGAGLMLGLEVIDAVAAPHGRLALAAVQQALRDGLLLLADGPGANVLAFTPPFAIADGEIDFAAERLQEYLTSLPGSIS